jgi:thiol:disulfide interchange protein
MLRNTVRGVLGLILVAAATWLANWVTELIFGPEDTGSRA